VPFLDKDEYFQTYIEAVEGLVASGNLAEVARISEEPHMSQSLA
jgi:hypothetical protein